MKTYGLSLLAAASALALTAGSASAFDTVNWRWDNTVTENVYKTITINEIFDPKGVVLLEDLQVQVGNVAATSTVNGVYNNQPAGAGGPVTVDLGTMSFSGELNSSTGDITGSANAPTLPNEQYLDGTVALNSPHTVSMNFDLGTITVNTPAGGSFNALTELPEVVSTATAVGNNVSITSDVMVEMHDGQFLFNVPGGAPTHGDLAALTGMAALFDDHGDVNTNQLVAAAVLLGAATGVLTPANITATSSVSNILNASVDSAATAVGNNKSIELLSGNIGDHVMIGDVTQVSFANLSAASSVSGVTLNNYTNLGKLQAPIVSSVATAVGNNLSITVGKPVTP